MADFNKPDNTSSHVVLWGWVRDMVASCAAILDSRRSADTNVPLYAKRWNNATRRFQEFNGSVWTDIIILGTSIDQATTTVRGTVQLATNAEVTAGTNTEKAVVPSSLKVELDKKAALAGSSSQVFNAANATNDTHVINRQTGDIRYAALGGNNTQKFKVAPATAADEAVRLEQTGGLIDVQIFSTAGTFTWNRPAGTRAIEVFCLGGGGGGGCAISTGAGQAAVAGAGSAGNFAYSFMNSPDASYSVTVGAGGAGAPYDIYAIAGSNGGESNFGGTIVRAGGGIGGVGGGILSTFPINGAVISVTSSIMVGQWTIRAPLPSAALVLSATSIYLNAGGAIVPWLGMHSVGQVANFILYGAGSSGLSASIAGGGGTGVYRTQSDSGSKRGGNGAAGLVMVKSYR